MARFLKYYLAITGIAAIFTLAFPGLVYILAYVGVGLILALTPTAFMWGCIFALGYGLARIVVRPLYATSAALLVTAFILWSIPQPSIRAAELALVNHQLDNVTPAGLIGLEGDIRIDTRSPQYAEPGRGRPGIAAYHCDSRCIAILLEPGVSSVTITRARAPNFEYVRSDLSQPDNSSRTYRLKPHGQCGDEGIEFDHQRISNQFGETMEARRAVAAEWSMKFATEYCLAGGAPLTRYDMVLRTGYWQSRDREPQGFKISTDLVTADAHFSDIRNGKGEVLFRRISVVADALNAPLMILPEGEDFRFGWSRRSHPPRIADAWKKTDEAVDAVIAVKRSSAIGESVANARGAVQEFFVESATATGQSASTVILNYMEILGKTKPVPEDVALMESLLRDARLEDLPGAWILPRIFSAEQLNSFLPAIISKLSMKASVEPARQNDLGWALRNWPRAAFENPEQATLALLADPDLRIRAIGLVARMSDMGERGAPLVADIIEQHLEAAAGDSGRDQLQRRTARAGVSALCYMGAQAARELPRMRDIERKFPPDVTERYDWNVMMLRLGKPLTEIKQPDGSGSKEQQYFNGLKNMLARFDADRDCRNR